jgi:hypothetical protein
VIFVNAEHSEPGESRLLFQEPPGRSIDASYRIALTPNALLATLFVYRIQPVMAAAESSLPANAIGMLEHL